MANAQDQKYPCSRDDVFRAINSEREYKLRRWGYRCNDGTFTEPAHGVCDFLTYMRHYLARADEAAATMAGCAPALEELCKVVALGVACLEMNGVKSRDCVGGIINGRDGKRA
jgi:hypothetical protein